MRTPPRSTTRLLGISFAVLAAAAAPALVACDMADVGAGTTINVMRRASVGLARIEDPGLAEEAMPGTIGQMEGLLAVRPRDTALHVLAARAYASYGYAFLEEHYEVSTANGDEDEVIEGWRRRASLAYRRSRDLGLENLDILRGRDGGMADARRQGIEAFTAYLQGFSANDETVATMFFTAYSWARWVGMNRDDVNALVDLPFVTALAERVLQLDSTFMGHAPIALRAGLWASIPEQVGGRPREARAEFERAIQLTNRHNWMYLVTEARLAAVALQDRATYQALLQEVVDGDYNVDPDNRLQNIVAQIRARRYLAEIDDLFLPEGEGGDEGEAASDGASE